LLVIGALTPGDAVREAHGERPRWGRTRRRATADAVAVEAAPSAQAPAEAAVEVAVAAEVVPEAALAKNKRPSRAAAAEELLPAVAAPVAAAAEVVQLELATGPEVAAATETAAKAIPPDEPHAPAPSRPGLRRRMAFAWRLNRTLEVSLVVVGGAALAVALAFGGLGARAASQSGKPFAVALAEANFEDWLYASAETLDIGLGSYVPNVRGLPAIVAALKPRKYVKPTWQPRLASRVDLELAGERNSSLTRMLERFDELLINLT